MEILLSELHDTSIQLQATVPTQLTEDFMHAASMRLDYAFSFGSLSARSIIPILLLMLLVVLLFVCKQRKWHRWPTDWRS